MILDSLPFYLACSDLQNFHIIMEELMFSLLIPFIAQASAVSLCFLEFICCIYAIPWSFSDKNFLPLCREKVVEGEIPSDIAAAVAEKRRELIESISEVDDELADMFLNDQPITAEILAVST